MNKLNQKLPDELIKELAELESKLSTDSWTEINENYYSYLRERLNKTEDEIGPRLVKSFKHDFMPVWAIVIPAGRMHTDTGEVVSYYHIVLEFMDELEPNGQYEFLSETEMKEKFNITF
jgi:hypothetical protein